MFVSKKLVWIYSYSHSCNFVDTNIFGHSFVSKFSRMSHSALNLFRPIMRSPQKSGVHTNIQAWHVKKITTSVPHSACVVLFICNVPEIFDCLNRFYASSWEICMEVKLPLINQEASIGLERLWKWTNAMSEMLTNW